MPLDSFEESGNLEFALETPSLPFRFVTHYPADESGRVCVGKNNERHHTNHLSAREK